ncbi:hypothetical protein URS_2216 [Acinetobacter ursingii]|nr:hypothetical protein URS_2216 [Acinetobacter ursingii]
MHAGVPYDFLNGVCRHERQAQAGSALAQFLNGVCRHELVCAI